MFRGNVLCASSVLKIKASKQQAGSTLFAACLLHSSTLKMDVAPSSESSVNFYHNSKDSLFIDIALRTLNVTKQKADGLVIL